MEGADGEGATYDIVVLSADSGGIAGTAASSYDGDRRACQAHLEVQAAQDDAQETKKETSNWIAGL